MGRDLFEVRPLDHFDLVEIGLVVAAGQREVEQLANFWEGVGDCPSVTGSCWRIQPGELGVRYARVTCAGISPCRLAATVNASSCGTVQPLAGSSTVTVVRCGQRTWEKGLKNRCPPMATYLGQHVTEKATGATAIPAANHASGWTELRVAKASRERNAADGLGDLVQRFLDKLLASRGFQFACSLSCASSYLSSR